MKTGELYVEQIVVGSLVLATAALPWLPEIIEAVPSEAAVSIVTASIAVGIAFLIGVPFDRLADTISDRLDAHNRLRFALRKAKGRRLEPGAAEAPGTGHDYFPEDRLRLSALREAAPVVEWIDYHRSRIRLTRALWVYGPGCMLAATIGSSRWQGCEQWIGPAAWLASIVLAYVAWAALSFGAKLPRTDHAGDFAEYAKKDGWLDRGEVKDSKLAKSVAAVWFSEWPSWLIPLGLFLAAATAALGPAGTAATLPMAAAVGGAATVVVSAWSWWRISDTFRSYLYDIARWPGAPDKGS